MRRWTGGPADAPRTSRAVGSVLGMRMGPYDVRPVGGAAGCLVMIAVSVLASVLLTVLANLLLR